MLIRCVEAFRDLKVGGKPMRSVGEEWEADASRLAEINRAGYGTLAEAVETAPEPREGAKRAAERPTAPSEGDLDAMTVRQLVELCIIEGVETEGRPKKAELLSALKAHYGIG